MKLTACFATLAMAEKVPQDDCIDNGIESPLDHRFYVDHIKCDKNNIMCKPICAKNAVINSNRKRYHCDKRGNEYRWKPVNPDIFPQCKSCGALSVSDLRSRVLLNGDPRFDSSITVSCPLGKSLSSQRSGNWMTSWVKFNCKCNKRAKSCHWRADNVWSKTGGSHHVELQQVECVEAVKNPPSTGPPLPPGLTCKREDGTRIVDGQEADPNTWPWMVQLGYDGSLCGGVIVGENLVLTAGHCCASYHQIGEISAKVGSLNKGNGKMIEFKKKVMHPKYNTPNGEAENDICLLFPKHPIEMVTGSIDRACLPNPDEQRPPAGTRCWTAGFGMMWWDGVFPTKLMEVDLQLLSDHECAATDVSHLFDSSMHTCAGWPEGRKDACSGDSGGPLICVSKDNQPVLWGLTSFGIRCGERNSPGVYARVEKYMSWIAEEVEKQRHN